MSIQFVGKHLVDLTTGEIINPVYEVVKTQASTDDKRYYSATAVCPNDAVDKGQVLDFIKHTVDKRKLKTVNKVKEYKKESDYGVRTLKQKAFMSNPQFEVLNTLSTLVVYKNIVLEEKKTLAEKLGVGVNNLDKKLKTVSAWVEVDKQNVRKGFIKLLINPSLVFRAEHGRIGSMTEKALVEFHKVDPETQYNALYVPFVGPLQPYSAPQWSKSTETYLDNLRDKLAKKWAAKVFDEEDIQFEVEYKLDAIETEFVKDYYSGNKNSRFYKQEAKVEAVPSWVSEELPEFDYSCVQYEESSTYF